MTDHHTLSQRLESLYFLGLARMPKFAIRTKRAKSFIIVITHYFLEMFMPTVRSMFTKSSSVPRAFFDFIIWINVLVHTLRVTTLSKLREEKALRHSGQIVAM
jgi:hypothetical protein